MPFLFSLLFRCNVEQHQIEMIRGDGRIHRTVAWENIDPRYLVVHPVRRFLAFVNYFNRQKITVNVCVLFLKAEILFEFWR